MLRFNNDYSEGALPEIIEALAKTNLEQTAGYGEDEYCERARGYIRTACNAPQAEIHFLAGGTQTNLVVISAALRSHQAALAVESGHINTHEAGAIESCGHKVVTVKGEKGKLSAKDISRVHDAHIADSAREHIAQPKLVYVSNPTEWGTLYSKSELCEISEACKECGFYLFLDGARLGYGLTSPENDLTLADIAKYCDVFYIGGTKCGALFGEAVVITNDALKEDFRYIMKQKGAMLAKGRLLGIQFCELFKDGLYERACKNANDLAMKIRDAFVSKGFEFYLESPTNQQFPIMTPKQIAELSEKYVFSTDIMVIDKEHTATRFCTSWATSEQAVDTLVKDIANCSG